MMTTQFKEIFQRGSKTYYNASRFFPRRVQDDVYILYSFVRVADDFVDKIPQDPKGLKEYSEMALGINKPKGKNSEIIESFLELARKNGFEKEWTVSFLDSMSQDVTKRNYKTLAEVEEYMYGSAEVVGLWMAKLLGLPNRSYPYAKLLGKHFQYINFIRDIAEDNYLKRKYIPSEFLQGHNLTSLHKSEVFFKKEEFEDLIREEIKRSLEWRQKSLEGFKYIPYRYRIAISAADKMYYWTAQKIYRNPLVVFEQKVKPSRQRIIISGFLSILHKIGA